MADGLVGPALREHDRAAEQVGPPQVERVVGDLEKRDRPANVAERRDGLALELGEPSERPVQPHARVGVGQVLGLVQHVVENFLRPLQVSAVSERVAEVGREAQPRGRVIGGARFELLETPLEQLDGQVGPPARRVGPAEGRVDVGTDARRELEACETGLQALDRRRGASGVAAAKPSAMFARAAATVSPASTASSRRTASFASAWSGCSARRSSSSASAIFNSRSSVSRSSEPVSR